MNIPSDAINTDEPQKTQKGGEARFSTPPAPSVRKPPLPPLFDALLPYLGLSLLWAVIVWLVNPFTESPFADDWMYARTVLDLVNTGKFKLNDFGAVTLFAQALWGGFFARLFGFSMTTLRFSTLTIGWLGLFVMYRLLKEAGAGRFLAFVGAALLATTPFYVLFSNTFMTDVPFLVMVLASLLFLIRWIRDERPADLAAGLALACITVLIRQLAIVVPLAFSAAYLVKKDFRPKGFLAAAGACAAVAGTLAGFEHWLRTTSGLPIMYVAKHHFLRAVFSPQNGPRFYALLCQAIVYRGMVVVVYLGLFLSPLITLAAPAVWRRLSKRERWLGAAAAALFIAATVIALRPARLIMPIGTDQLRDFGLGFEHMSGNENFLPKAPRGFWLAVTAVSFAGAGALVFYAAVCAARFVKDAFGGRGVSAHWRFALCFGACLVHFLPFSLTGHFDRYQLFYIPFMLLWLSQEGAVISGPRFRALAPAALFLAGALAVFAVGGTHDCLARNRARWEALRYLMNVQKISPAEIDGGYEFNGWYTFDPHYLKKTTIHWWWVIDDKYAVSYTPLEGYEPLFRVPYRRWLPPGEGSIYAARRISDRPPYTGPLTPVYQV